MKKVLFQLVHFALIFSLLFSIQACGSRDGSDSSDTTTDTTTGGGTTTPAVTVASIKLSSDSAAINPGATTNINVTLLNSTGQFVDTPKDVTFTLSSPELGSIDPSVTVSGGEAHKPFTANNIEGIVTITGTVDGKSDSQQIQISREVAANTVTLTADPEIVSAGGTAVVTAEVLDGAGNPMPNGTTVNFSIDNTELGTIVPSDTTTDGVAQATFSAGTTKPGTATITATSGAASGTTAIEVREIAAGSIEFVSATPQIVSIKGAGGIETSEIKFLVNDGNGKPIASSQSVRVALSGPNGGEYIGPDSGVTETVVGTINGEATIILHSGTIPGTATIKATVVGTSLETSSGVIAIGGGIPSEGRFSLSTTTFNLEGGNYDGITTNITVRIADRYGNYNVLKGTSVSFYSECGAIDRAVNLDSEGSGSVVFRTQRPHPQDIPLTDSDAPAAARFWDELGVEMTYGNNPSSGICTIVAVVDGEEEFTDANANGAYDLSEWPSVVDTYDDIHLDKDDDPEDIPFGEETVGYPFDPAFEHLIVDRDKNGLFDGMNGEWDANKRISQQIKLFFTGMPSISVAEDGLPPTPVNEGDMITVADSGSKKINFAIHDSNFNPPIGGTTFSVSTDVGVLSGKTEGSFSDAPLDYKNLGAKIFSVTISDDNPGDTDPPVIGTLEFSWTWKGDEYTFSTPVSID